MNKELLESTYQEEIFQIRLRSVVVINEAWDKLGLKEHELLTKIISALRISIDAVTMVSQPGLDVTHFHNKTNQLIYFGKLPAGVSYYEVLQSGNLSFICAESLTQLVDNEPARKQLWQGLKKLFAI
jgi:DNA polymerase III psi subunit